MLATAGFDPDTAVAGLIAFALLHAGALLWLPILALPAMLAGPGQIDAVVLDDGHVGHAEPSYPAFLSIRRRSTTICTSMSLPAGGSRNSSSDPILTATLPSWRTVTPPTTSSSDITARHSMLWLAGCRKICRSVSR